MLPIVAIFGPPRRAKVRAPGEQRCRALATPSSRLALRLLAVAGVAASLLRAESPVRGYDRIPTSIIRMAAISDTPSESFAPAGQMLLVEELRPSWGHTPVLRVD